MAVKQLNLEVQDAVLLWGIIDGFLIGKIGDYPRAKRILADLSKMIDEEEEDEVLETNRKPETEMGPKW